MKTNYIKIAKKIAKKIEYKVPDIGVVLGSGWGDFPSLLKNKVVIPYASISGMPKTKVAGHEGNFIFGTLHGKKVLCIQGRFHLYEGHSVATTVMPIRVLKQLGTKVVAITNAAGGINPKYDVGDIVIVNDQINLSGHNPLIGLPQKDGYPMFLDMTKPFDEKLNKNAYNICKQNKIGVNYGTYLQLMGPSYETPAEIKMARAMGADLVGMSTAVEVIMAKYEGMRAVVLSCVTNKAAGMEHEKLDHKDVLEVSKVNKDKLKLVLEEVIKTIEH